MTNQTTLYAGVLGDPVGHSLSPKLHGYWLKKYNIPGSYEAIQIAPDMLQRTLRGLPRKKFKGVNLTIPHKEAANLYVDERDDSAKRVGAINTVTVMEGGKLKGSNTDAYGFYANLKEQAPQLAIKGKRVVVLGAGGAARAVCVALQDMEAADIIIINRTKEKAERIAGAVGKPCRVEMWEKRDDLLEAASLLVNATPLGMKGQQPLNISLHALPTDAAVADLVYKPLETELLRQAKARGNLAIDGLGMLIWQAVPAFAAWFGVTPEVDDQLRKHLKEEA